MYVCVGAWGARRMGDGQAFLVPNQDGRRRGGFSELSNTAVARNTGHLEVWLFFPYSENPDSGTDAQLDTERRE